MTNCCFVIPSYNHHEAIERTIEALEAYALPIIIIDDGSNQVTQNTLLNVAAKFARVTLKRREENGGKGAAVHDGLLLAHQMGFEHALQIDADGQHNLNDIGAMLTESQAHPEALISGKPVYDSSISKGRYYGRFVTHFWVHVETLSFDIKDSMCGFRVYPLAAYKALTDKVSLGKRMDYDIEVMVRLYWHGVPIRFVDTNVIYPEGGVSHFNVFKDNVLISKMHTRLFFGMLLRSPVLLFRKLSAKGRS